MRTFVLALAAAAGLAGAQAQAAPVALPLERGIVDVQTIRPTVVQHVQYIDGRREEWRRREEMRRREEWRRRHRWHERDDRRY